MWGTAWTNFRDTPDAGKRLVASSNTVCSVVHIGRDSSTAEHVGNAQGPAPVIECQTRWVVRRLFPARHPGAQGCRGIRALALVPLRPNGINNMRYML